MAIEGGEQLSIPSLQVEGTITAGGVVTAASFATSSDERLKTNIQTIQGALDIIGAVRGVTFNWKADGAESFGVIAQELNELIPGLVSEHNGFYVVNYAGFIPYIIEAIKELRDIVTK